MMAVLLQACALLLAFPASQKLLFFSQDQPPIFLASPDFAGLLVDLGMQEMNLHSFYKNLLIF